MMRYILSALLLALLPLVTVTGLAQADLDADFTAADGAFSFRYPSNWIINTDEAFVGVGSKEVELFFYSPEDVSALLDEDYTDPEEALPVWVLTFFDIELEVTGFTQDDGRAAALAFAASDTDAALFIATAFSDGAIGMVEAYGTPAAIRANSSLIGDIAGTFDRPATAANPDKGAQATPVAAGGIPASLEDYDEDYDTVVAELENTGLIAGGGRRIFAEDYAFFSGQGSWYTPLARDRSHTNFVMSGELSFTPSGAAELETCTLGLRVAWSGSTTSAYVDVGLATGDRAFYLDIPEAGDPVNGVVSNIDLTVPHTFTILAIDDTLTVYMDGALIFENVAIEPRAGSWGIGLVGGGAGAQCEGRDIWVHSVPQPGVCEIRAAGSVNRRSGPGTSFDSPGQLAAGSVTRAIGQTQGADGFTWWQLEDESWVRDDVIAAEGDCAAMPETAP